MHAAVNILRIMFRYWSLNRLISKGLLFLYTLYSKECTENLHKHIIMVEKITNKFEYLSILINFNEVWRRTQKRIWNVSHYLSGTCYKHIKQFPFHRKTIVSPILCPLQFPPFGVQDADFLALIFTCAKQAGKLVFTTFKFDSIPVRWKWVNVAWLT